MVGYVFYGERGSIGVASTPKQAEQLCDRGEVKEMDVGCHIHGFRPVRAEKPNGAKHVIWFSPNDQSYPQLVAALETVGIDYRKLKTSRPDSDRHPVGCSCGAPDCPEWIAAQLGQPAR